MSKVPRESSRDGSRDLYIQNKFTEAAYLTSALSRRSLNVFLSVYSLLFVYFLKSTGRWSQVYSYLLNSAVFKER